MTTEPVTITLIGVDCAVDPRKVGLARASLAGDVVRIHELAVGTAGWEDWVSQRLLVQEHAVLALDAPLGWPAPLGPALAAHSAGEPLVEDANALFRRATDNFVAERIGKRPLDVGADRIARTALAALRSIGCIRGKTEPLPLVVDGDDPGGRRMLEVYPAATLQARGLSPRGYKGPAGLPRRRELFSELSDELETDLSREDVVASDHVFDAILCALAAADYCRGVALAPPVHLRGAARTEGWIWVRKPREVG